LHIGYSHWSETICLFEEICIYANFFVKYVGGSAHRTHWKSLTYFTNNFTKINFSRKTRRV